MMARRSVKEMAEEMAGRIIASGTVKEKKLQEEIDRLIVVARTGGDREMVLKAENAKLRHDAAAARKFRSAIRYIVKFVSEEAKSS